MRINDIILSSIVEDQNHINDAVLDIMSIMAGEGIDSVNFNMIIDNLKHQGIDIDEHALFDILDNLAIVRNIKDGVVFFNTDSDSSQNQYKEVDPKKDEKKVAKLARKQVKKELRK